MKEFGLSRAERVKRKKDFEIIYTSGKVLYSADKKLKAVFIDLKDGFEHLPASGGSEIMNTAERNRPPAFAVAVSRKAGCAVWRNRIKRLVREVYRQNKQTLVKQHVLIVFSPFMLNQKKNGKIFLKDLLPPVVDLLKKINSSN